MWFAKIPENPAGQEMVSSRPWNWMDALAEAHASLVNIKFSYDWDWPGAEKEFQCANALNPNDSSSHLYHGFYFASLEKRMKLSWKLVKLDRTFATVP